MPVAHFTEHAVYLTGGGHDRVHHFSIKNKLLGTQQVKQVFCFVAQLHQVCCFQKTGTTLDGVKTPENSGQQIGIFRALLQFDQLAVHVFQQVACLGQEVL